MQRAVNTIFRLQKHIIKTTLESQYLIVIKGLIYWDNNGKFKAIRISNKRGVGERRYRKEDIIKIMTQLE